MDTPKFKQIILLGGGHAHALLVKMWGMNPLAGVQLVLVSPSWKTPYSGMLPGLLAGHYSTDDIHIDLRKLCRWANVRFIETAATFINPELQTVQLNARAELSYDLLSLDIGSTPDTNLPGLNEFAQTVKPISSFYSRFEKLLQRLREQAATDEPLRVAVIGGGAGGVEVSLALAERLARENLSAQLQLIVRDKSILRGYPASISRTAQSAFKRYGVEIVDNFDVAAVRADGVLSKSGASIQCDEIFFCTQARAASWLAETGLDCDERGFVRVNAALQSLSHCTIFAAGDVAEMVESPREKAGVYAVRQAPVLFENIKRALLGQDLKVFRPQSHFLSLLSLGSNKAIASRSGLSLKNPLLQGNIWRWKDRIDRRFMAMLQDLSPLNMTADNAVDLALLTDDEQLEEINPEMRCGGCGGKVGTDILQQVLMDVTGQQEFAPEDAAQITLNSSTLIQSVDQIKAPIDDPFIFGRIATLHALSDAYAMNATPTSAQLMLNLPYAGEQQQRREMSELMRGILFELHRADCQLLGGHTAEGRDLSVGLVVNAEPKAGRQALSLKSSLQAGDLLVLTKPLGTGVVLAAHMPASPVQARGDWVCAAIDNMLISNRQASEVFSHLEIAACTDVTGFGLLGHLCEMLRAASLSAELALDKLPLLPGALELSNAGVKSSLYRQNSLAIKALSISAAVCQDARFPLLFDPQTSGGLLAGVSADKLAQLQNTGLDFWVVGRVCESSEQDWDLTIT